MHRTLTESGFASLGETNGGSGPIRTEQPFAHGRNGNGSPHGSHLSSGTVKIYQDKLKIKTLGEFDVIDITSEVEKSIQACGVSEGYALIFSPHTTCAVLLNEKESGLLSDINAVLCRLVPQADGYLHDDFEIRTENMQEGETQNAHAHLRQLLAAKTSEYIPISKGSLLLGRWQRVMFVEFDCSRDREALIQICGI